MGDTLISAINFDPKFDLVFERKTKLTPSQLWQGWTDPDTVLKWLCPRPWKVADCRIDLRPGGEFYNVMVGPNGERNENHGCFLEVIKDQKLVWTGMMTKGFRPAPNNPMGFGFVVNLEFIKTAEGSLYRAVVYHTDEEGRKKHEEMGFQEGWGLALNQLEELF